MAEIMRGGVNEVEKIGDTVRRPVGHWTPAVHALLAHLAAHGFDGAPRAHGLDETGREILDYLPGEVTDDARAIPVPALRDVARLLRRYHDATVDFTPPADATWYWPPRSPAEVICHGDIAPYNCVVRCGRPVGFIDFDTAHPGPRRWDVAYAAYRFVPLTAPDNPDGALPAGRQGRRLREFCDAYGLGEPDRRVLAETVVARLHALVDHIRTRAAAGDQAFARHLAEGHPDIYLADIRHVEACAEGYRQVLLEIG